MESPFRTYGLVIAAALLGVFLQGVLTWRDKWLLQTQLPYLVRGYTFFQHGGMWADIMLIPSIVGEIVSRHELRFSSGTSLILLGISMLGWYVLLQVYKKAGKIWPEAHTHDGRTTAAGWVHYGFAVMVTWVFLLFIVTVPGKDIPTNELVFLGASFGIFYPLGAWKFNNRIWNWRKNLPKTQILILYAVTSLILLSKYEHWF